jgi:predicted hotdog family 3-hydroxylacyl-ACP dehydratase
MLLLDRFVDGDVDWARAEARIGETHPFHAPGLGVPSWALIESFAQTAALIGGLQARAERVPVPQGFLLGTRRFTCTVPHVPVGTTLVLEARTSFRDSNGMGAYHCRALNDDLALECVLTVYAPPADP